MTATKQSAESRPVENRWVAQLHLQNNRCMFASWAVLALCRGACLASQQGLATLCCTNLPLLPVSHYLKSTGTLLE